MPIESTDSLWPAPTAGTSIRGTIGVPGSKSATNRALVLAALANGPSRVSEALDARDTRLMIAALMSLGVRADIRHEARDGNATIEIVPGPLRGPATIDVGLAGTVMRFMPPVAALATGDIHFDGDAGARQRPMAAILDALRAVGVRISGDGADANRLPFTVHGSGRVAGGEVHVDASASSQFVSALLLSGARFDGGLTLRHTGQSVPSQPHIDMTIQMLAEHGVEVDIASPRTWRVEPQPIRPIDRVIEPDLSNAAPFLAAAMVTRGEVTILDWPSSTTQPGDALRDLLQQMGAVVSRAGGNLTVSMHQEITGIDVDLHDVGELTPTIAALAALANSPTRLRGIAHLRGHETDRLAALAHEINNLGGQAVETADGLDIRPRPMHGGDFASYHDHRMATAGAIIGLRIPGVRVENIQTTAKTLPGFTSRWSALIQGAAVSDA